MYLRMATMSFMQDHILTRNLRYSATIYALYFNLAFSRVLKSNLGLMKHYANSFLKSFLKHFLKDKIFTKQVIKGCGYYKLHIFF